MKGYDTLLLSDNKTLVNDSDIKYEGITEYKFLNKTAYNELILAQEDTVYFHIVEAVKNFYNKYGNTRQAWMKLTRKFYSTTGSPKTRLHKKFCKYKLYDVTRHLK